MAEKRMLSKKITDHDNFIALSASAQALYMHLNLSADDEGFCNQVSLAMFKAHAGTQDLEALIDKKYLMRFDNGVLLIKHWKINNNLRKDRCAPTSYVDERAQIVEKPDGSYTWQPSDNQVTTNGQPNVRIRQHKIGKDSIDYSSCCYGGGKVKILDMLSEEETSNIFDTYEDADYLVDAVEAEINGKLKGGEIQNFYRYIIGYANNKGWPRTERL